MRRRSLFALPVAAAAAALPAVKPPMVEMHANDVAPVASVVDRAVDRYISDFGTFSAMDVNAVMRKHRAGLRDWLVSHG